jgi:hypothetical protein
MLVSEDMAAIEEMPRVGTELLAGFIHEDR